MLTPGLGPALELEPTPGLALVPELVLVPWHGLQQRLFPAALSFLQELAFLFYSIEPVCLNICRQ